MKALIKFARVRIVITLYALAFLGSAIGGGVNTYTLLLIFLIIPLTIHANSINDFSDLAIDKVNLHDAYDRPLVTRDLSFRSFWIIHFASGIFAIVLSFFYGTNAVILTTVVLTINYLYSLKPFRLSDRGIFSQLVLSFAYVYFPLSLGFWSSNPTTEYPWLISLGVFFAFTGRLLLKDFRDIVGDRQYDKKTFLIRHGKDITCIVSGICWALGAFIILSGTSFVLGVSLPVLVGLFLVILLLRALNASSSITKQQNIIALIAKSANSMIITLLVFFLCQNAETLSPLEIVSIPTVIGSMLLLFNGVIPSLRIVLSRHVQ